MSFHPTTGRVDLDGTPFANGVIHFQFADFARDSTLLKWRRSGNAFAASADDLEFRVDTPHDTLKIEVRNKGKRERFWVETQVVFAPADLDEPLPAREWREYIHAQNMGLNCGVKKVGLATRWLANNPESSMTYALRRDADGLTILLASVPPLAPDYVYFRALHAEGHMEGDFGLTIRSEQARLLKPGRKGAVSPILVKTGDDPSALLEGLGDRYAKAMGLPRRAPVAGWNSWDYYAGAVRSEHMFANQRAAKKRFGDKVRYFVIDEGWEPRWGDWVANWKFPEGTKAFCKKVKAAGGLPGVWTAPLLVNRYTNLYRDHPDWFARDDAGDIPNDLLAYGPMSYLDPTHPEAAAWLVALFRRLRRDGFEYFKIDFSQQVLECSRFHDMTVGRGGILRRTFELIREGIGEKAYLLGCGAPYESVVGIVDAVRIVGDIHDYWSHVMRNAPDIAARWWMHGKLWSNDADFLVVRSEDTSPDLSLRRQGVDQPLPATSTGWLAGRPFRLNEARVHAMLVLLSGGDVILGDDLGKLNAAGLAVLRKVLDAPRTRAATPLDLFDRHDALPSLWVKEEEDHHFIGVFNWDEEPRDFRVDLDLLPDAPRGRVRTFWGEEEVEPLDNAVSLRLAPRSCEGLMVYKG